ncbi:hypothetical protein [Xanthobacter sediminis]
MRRLAAFAAAILAMPVAMAAEPLVERASVIDGGTLEIHGVRIRLKGIDARQTCKMKGIGEAVRCGTPWGRANGWNHPLKPLLHKG